MVMKLMNEPGYQRIGTVKTKLTCGGFILILINGVINLVKSSGELNKQRGSVTDTVILTTALFLSRNGNQLCCAVINHQKLELINGLLDFLTQENN